MKLRTPDPTSEERLDALRAEAAATGRVDGEGIRPTGSPMPDVTPNYYNLPLLKPPVWTWEVPAYFFVGGAAGATAFIAFAARVTGADAKLVRQAQWIAAIGAVASTPLLISDLGRPERFLNMLRVFKPQSPMSVGAWILAGFGTASGMTVVTRGPLRDLFAAVSAITGLGMATYTGVLLGATSTPVWAKNVSLLPALFGASALASAGACLELAGNRTRALNLLGLATSAVETAIGVKLEGSEATSQMTMRIAGALSGPVPLVIRLLYGKSKRARQAAAVSALVGSLITRFAWVEAGADSVRADAPRSRHPVG